MFQLLSMWNRNRTVSSLTSAVRMSYGRDVPADEVSAVMLQMDRGCLFESPVSGNWRELYARAQRRQSLFTRILHNYLFFKIALVRPEPFIRAVWPWVSFLFTRGFLLFAIFVACLGLWLVSRQWDIFINTFPYIFSLEGAALSVLAIILVKSLHELGHAFVAWRYGCRIPVMGVAFMLMTPLLYTDVSDAWRLKSRRARFQIDVAGILTELCIGAFALLAWVFLPDGPVRGVAFVMATAGWVLSLLINLNPFMRFDGYYIFADLIGVDNLQPRAFAHLRWRLRRLLFGLGHEPPEQFTPRLDLVVTLYAICTIIYRLVLYLGIALLVYYFTIKILGIFLFAVEIGFFIIRPIWSEIRQWWHLRAEICRHRRTFVTFSVFAVLIGLMFMPLSSNIRAPALLMPQTFARLFSGEAARVDHIHISNGQIVARGDVLFTLTSPALDEELRLTEIQLALARYRLTHIGDDLHDTSKRGVLESELQSLIVKRHGLKERMAKLTIRAPFDGRVYDLDPGLLPGRWVSQEQRLAFLTSDTGIVARGYVSDNDYGRLQNGARGRFIPGNPDLPPAAAKLRSITPSAIDRINLPQLTSVYGGAVAATVTQDGSLIPETAQHELVAQLSPAAEPLIRTVPGTLIFQGNPQSMAEITWRQVLRVLIRESGI